jgi:hypothetical protein
MMKPTMMILLGVVGLTSCTDPHNSGEFAMDDQAFLNNVRTIQGLRIYFGHQSVGRNILDGVKQLLTKTGADGLNVVHLEQGTVLPDSFFAESSVGKNEYPGTKCDAFAEKVRTRFGDSLDMAMMKFCYVDITAATDVKATFDSYRSIIDSLKQSFSQTSFVHVTAPLMIRRPWKQYVKMLLGRAGSPDLENARRNEFNTLLVKQYPDDPVFDLARVESTYPDGTRCSFEFEGKTAYAMVSRYSSDGGHLNEEGQKRAAWELVRVLAETAKRRAE